MAVTEYERLSRRVEDLRDTVPKSPLGLGTRDEGAGDARIRREKIEAVG